MARRARSSQAVVPDETFDALVFDWEGTAVADRQADASRLRGRVEALCAAGVHVFVVSGTDAGNVDGQLRARPAGRGRLHLCVNRGSEVFEVGGDGPVLVFRRTATAAEEAALDQAAKQTIAWLRERGVEAALVAAPLNCRRIDLIPSPLIPAPLIPSPECPEAKKVVAAATEAARDAGVVEPRVTSDVRHVEIGLTDKSDSARWAAAWLGERGITGALVLVGGNEFGPVGGVQGSDSLLRVEALDRAVVVSVGIEPGGVPADVVALGGGPARFEALLEAQLARRADRRVPQIDLNPGWVVHLPAGHANDRVAESLGALSSGWAGVRASREEDGNGGAPLFVVNGVYSDDRLLPGPIWTGLHPAGGHRWREGRRVVDLRTGVLARFDDQAGGLRSVRFVSMAVPFAMGMRAEAPASRLAAGDLLLPPSPAGDFESEDRDGVRVARTGSGAQHIAVAARDRVAVAGHRRVVERLAAWASGPDSSESDEACRRLEGLDRAGFDALLAEHREGWARRWADAEVTIEGAPDDQLAARFAVFHLLSAASGAGEAAVGARGLTGAAYSGHVFWDADVFVLPALAAIRPEAARAMLEYRIRRLPAARAAAQSRRLAGARFPWESAGDGADVTPRQARGRRGEVIPILTGTHEEHIVADVAWAAACYAGWTGHTTFLSGAGRDLLVDTARYWASRIRVDGQGRGHIYGVMGPDEYHEVVDDNAYTNVMARWNLRQGAGLLAAGEVERWRALADGLVDGWDARRGVYEQFAGYFDLEPLLISQVAPPPVAADLLLGPERVAGSQLIKQADVLMLHHLVPEEVSPGSLPSCLAFYEPRTAHGSSLSPAIHASLLARAGYPERALELFRLAARLDLDNLTGTTAGGLHLATMGGVWQALAYGFLGLRAWPDCLGVDPLLPEAWHSLGLRLRFHGQPVAVHAYHDRVAISCEAPLQVSISGGPPQTCVPPSTAFAIGASSHERSHS